MRSLVIAVSLLLTACSAERAAEPAYPQRSPGALLTQEAAAYRKSVVANPAYRLAVALDPALESFEGEVGISFDYLGDGAPLTVDFVGGEITELALNGAAVEFDYNGDFITLAAGGLQRGPQQLRIAYRHPYSQDGSGLYRYLDPEDGRTYLYTDFEPYDANRLFPHFDQPDLKASYQLKVRAPASWQVVSTTRERGVVVDGEQRVWDFPATKPLSSYVFSLHAGEYAVFEDRDFRYPLRLFSRQSMARYVDADSWFRWTRQGFDFFDEYFALPYPFEKYDQLLVPDFSAGAMENVAAVTFSETFLSRGESTRRERMSLAGVIMHEMAHMWFGDITTMAWWNGLWLNESFATYMSELARVNATEFHETWHAFFLGDKQWAYAEDQLVTTHPIELPVPDTDAAFTNFDGITYGKGASVLKQLGALLGEEVFRQGVRNYLAANAWSNTELEDFIGALAAAAGRELDGWAQRWLYRAGVNTISAEVQCEAGKITGMRLLQTAPEEYPTLREQRTAVALYQMDDNMLLQRHKFSLLFDGAVTAVPEAVGLACPDFVYPNYEDWAYVKVALDEGSVATAREHINALQDPMQRSMVWYDLFSMVLDARLPLTEYLDIVEANLAGEQDLNAAADLLGNLRTAFSYLHMSAAGEALLPEYADRIEKLLWGLLQDSSGDARQLWLGGYVDTANNETAFRRLAALLAGELRLPGFELDQDQRWRIVRKLNEFRWPGHAALVDQELARDGSSIGQENAVAARVLAARGEDKYAWMQKAIAADEDYSLRRSRTIANSLFVFSSQRALAAPYAAQLIDQLPLLSETHDVAFNDRVTWALLPRLCTAENVERLRRAVERFPDLSPAIVRNLKVSAQLDQRCVDIDSLLAAQGAADPALAGASDGGR